MGENRQEYSIIGTSVSEGIAIGMLSILSQEEEPVPQFPINDAQVDKEIQRYRQAVSSSRKDLQSLQDQLTGEGSMEAMTIIDTHIQMLDDPFMTTLMEEKIQQMLQNTESVFRSVMMDYEKQFNCIEDQFFKQRLMDVKDLSRRILKHLYPKQSSHNTLFKGAIIFSKELAPSHTAEACLYKVGAFLSERGGKTSHAALIARAQGIPYVANIDLKYLQELEGSFIIVDGLHGKVIANPSQATIEFYKQLQQNIAQEYELLSQDLDVEAMTQDGKKIQVLANIEKLSDLDHPYFRGAEGIGLFRSEFLVSQKDVMTISEQEQYILYSQILQKADHRSIVFRAFDLGSDKGVIDEAMLKEPNPALGCRGVRFLLLREDLFKRQLRALLRAGVHGKVSLLLPFITDVDELRAVKKLLLEVETELRCDGVLCCQTLRLGCMIEIPSAALGCEGLIQECDFFSIGTNDLIQYTFAMDRSHSSLSENYKSLHPAILKMLKMVIDVCKMAEKSVCICGEMGSNPLFIKLLVGLGLEQFSCAPRYIPLVKRTIRSFSYQNAKMFADQVLALRYAEETERMVIEEFHQ